MILPFFNNAWHTVRYTFIRVIFSIWLQLMEIIYE